MFFELLHNDDIQSAYQIICERVADLKEKGIDQYKDPYPKFDMFLERQGKNENFGLYLGHTLVGIVTLMKNYIPDGWKDNINSNNFLWLTTLFIPLKYKGRQFGNDILEKIHSYAIHNNISEIYLDCYYGDGFLEKYYERYGYTRVVKKIVEYPARSFEAVLMKKEIIPL